MNVLFTPYAPAPTCLSQNIEKNFYKFWWSQELDVLKQNAIISCRAWKDANKPRNGPIQQRYKQDKLLYKKKIREEQSAETSSFTNDLEEALQCKSGEDFWKVWKCKFPSNSADVLQVDGSADSAEIVGKFANYFEQNCKPFNIQRNEELKAEYTALRANYCGSAIFDNKRFNTEQISKLVNSLKSGKAAGLDELSSEHLKFSHPIVICILTELFNLFLDTAHIPASFAASYTVPIPKCDVHTRGLKLDDFRGISISPVISKLFEMALLEHFAEYFVTSDHQFGFKKHLGCRDAIYSVRNVIEHFVSNGSTVNICALDLSKAFDRMNHYALFIKLIKRNLPSIILTILEEWFSVYITCVRWNGHVSHFFSLLVGVRQGQVLSPLLFAICIDDIVVKAKNANAGCYISSIFCGIYLYADDILLIAPTRTSLQVLIDVCEKEVASLDMQINAKKSMCIRFGSRFDRQCAELTTGRGDSIKWVDTCRYLGVFFVSGRVLRCDFHDAKCRFFRAFNAILSKVGRFASEQVVIRLLRTKCLPILFYACEACPLLSRQIHSFDFSLTRTFMKLFRTGSPAIVQQCQLHFGFLPVKGQLHIKTARFLQKFAASDNVLCSLFVSSAKRQLTDIFHLYNSSISTACQLYNFIYDQLITVDV